MSDEIYGATGGTLGLALGAAGVGAVIRATLSSKRARLRRAKAKAKSKKKKQRKHKRMGRYA